MNPKQQTPINRNAKHHLTEDEIKAYNEQLLAALQSKKEIEAEKKEVAASYKNKIAEQELAIDKISNLMRVGYEIRPFSCYLVKNFDTGKREFFEFGTDRLVDSEPLNAGDYQLQMDEELEKATPTDQLQAVIDEKVEQADATPTEEQIAEHQADEFWDGGGATEPELEEAAPFEAIDEHPTNTEEENPFEEPEKGGEHEVEDDPFSTGEQDAQEDEDSDPFDFGDI